MFQTILIANRAEIALRVLLACKALGTHTVLVPSPAGPPLACPAVGRQAGVRQKRTAGRVDAAAGLAAGAVGTHAPICRLVEIGFGEDGPRRIAGTQE